MVSLWVADVSSAAVEVLWLGHGTVRLTSDTGKVIMIDAFLEKNPATPERYRDLGEIGKVDLILVTHGHIDHVDDLEELASLTVAKVVANYEYGLQLIRLGVVPRTQVIAMNKGGTITPLGRGIKVHMVPAEHSSSVDVRVFAPHFEGVIDPQRLGYLDGGTAVGYVVDFEDGFTVYASGDTDVFGDMGLIGELFSPDLELACIGGHFTMGPERAAYAMRELVKPRIVIPIHYGTYPVINRTPAELEAALSETSIEVLALEPGEAAEF